MLEKRLEAIMWSIALPGFAQMLNKRYIKGIVFIILEVIINVQARLNLAIIPSFHLNFTQAIEVTNYQWIMFYPCLYTFAIWDAYRDVGGDNLPFAFLPFVFSAFIGTIGVVYSINFLGPIFLPIICLLIGALTGFLIRKVILSKLHKTP